MNLALVAFATTLHAQDPPNILLILADDLGYGDLASYGAADMRTPHLDRLAAEGVSFSTFYANSSVCSPTRAALLTGLFPDVAGVPGVIRTHALNSWGFLDPHAVTLPTALRRGGYHTAIVGKWHLGLEPPNLPHQRGFDHVYAFWGDMMDDYFHHRRHGINYMHRGVQEIDPEGHATDLFSDEAARYVRERAPSDAPFFLYLAYNAPHTPIQPPEDWLDEVKRRQPGIDEKRAALVALIEHMDAGIGRVLEALEQTGQAQNTLVVFTSDNGGQVNVGATVGGLRGTKTEMYEGGLRVPAIVRWPGRIAPGSNSDAVLSIVDIFPTLAEAAGAPGPRALDGRSFLAGLLGEGAYPSPDRTIVFVRREGGRELGHPVYALRHGALKLVHNRPWEPFELYDLASDPREERDIADTRPRDYARMGALLRAHIQRAGRVPWQVER